MRLRQRLRRQCSATALCTLLLAAALQQAECGRSTWSVLEPEYTPEELASADAGLGGGGDPLIPLGPPEEQVYSLGFRIEDLVEEPASLRAREAPLPRPFDDGALGGNVTAAAAAPQYFADALPDTNETTTDNGGAGGQAADAGSWKYWEQPSDGSEFMCPYNTSGKPEVLDWGDGNKQPSAQECSKSCKAQRGCNAWFWCKDQGRNDCYDIQSDTWVKYHGCKLLNLSALPVMPPDPAAMKHMHEASLFRSFAAGYLKRELYVRPPNVIVATAVQRCTRGDWGESDHMWADHLTWLSVYNKMDYARLHGTTLHMKAIWNLKTRPVEVVSELLEEEAGNTDAEWLLWTSVRGMIANPAFAFPLIKDYEAVGAELVLFGSRDGVLSGDSWKHDTGVLLVKNTAWARQFFKEVAKVFRRPKVMRTFLTRDQHLHGPRNATMDQVMMYMLLKDKGVNQPKVHYERGFCLACFYRNHNLRAPTSYISHFASVPCCGEYSLQLDDGYHESLMQHANISRCNFMKALHRSAPLEVAHGPAPFRYRSTRLMDWVFVPGRKNLQPSAAACRDSCARNPRCTTWLWCARHGGCDDGKNLAPKTRPHQACDLLDAPPWAPLKEADRGPLYSSFSVGFMHDYVTPVADGDDTVVADSASAVAKARSSSTGGHRKRRGRRRPVAGTPADTSPGAIVAAPVMKLANMVLGPWRAQPHHARRIPPRQHPNVAIISAVPPNPCSFPIADHFNSLGVINKQDYARRHGWELHLSAENVDPSAIGNFNKMAFIKKMLAITPRADAEWIWWTDADTLITDTPYEFPFHRYEGYDLVVWGQRERIEQGDLEGINCGVMMFRNSDWSRAFLAQLSDYAHLGEEALLQMRPVLEREIFPLVKGFKDTPFIVYMLKTQLWQNEKYIERVYFEQEVGLNRHWLQVNWGAEEMPLLVHYAGCTVCHPPEGKLSEEVIRGCNDEFAKAYRFARCNLAAAYTNLSAAAICHYPAVDLSDMSIRLGV